jgi:hypothetical protein
VLVRIIISDRLKAGAYLGGALIVRFFLYLFIFGPALLIAHLVADRYTTLLCFYIGAFFVYTQLTVRLINSIYLSFERLDIENYLTLLNSSLMVLLIYGATQTKYGIIGIFVAHAIALVITMVLSLYILRSKFVIPVFHWDPQLWIELIKGTILVGAGRLSKIMWTQYC